MKVDSLLRACAATRRFSDFPSPLFSPHPDDRRGVFPFCRDACRKASQNALSLSPFPFPTGTPCGRPNEANFFSHIRRRQSAVRTLFCFLFPPLSPGHSSSPMEESLPPPFFPFPSLCPDKRKLLLACCPFPPLPLFFQSYADAKCGSKGRRALLSFRHSQAQAGQKRKRVFPPSLFLSFPLMGGPRTGGRSREQGPFQTQQIGRNFFSLFFFPFFCR